MTTYELLSVVAAFLAVGAAGLSGWVAWRQKRLNSQLVEIEEARESDRRERQASAKLVARLVQPPGKNRKEIRVRNEGEAVARNVRLEVAQKISSQDPRDVDGWDRLSEGPSKYPFSLDPGAEEVWWIHTSSHFSSPFDVVLQWDDGTGQDHEYRTALSL